MKKFITIMLLLFTSIGAIQSASAETLPFYLNGKDLDASIYEEVKKISLFNNLNEESVGSPYYLSIYFVNQSTSGGTAATTTSGLLAASTLGIIPIVTNEDKTLRFEIWINRISYASYEYTENFSDVGNLWTMNNGKKMNPEVLQWALKCIEDLHQKIAQDPKIKEMLAEHAFYFGQESE